MLAVLVKIGDIQLGAATQLTTLRLQLPQQQLDQGGLAAAIGANQRDLVAPQHLKGKVVDQGALGEIVPQMFGLEDQFAGALCLIHL